jgi:intergrase/recombinase
VIKISRTKNKNTICGGPDLNRRTPTGMEPESQQIPKFLTYMKDFSQWLKTKNLSPGYSRALTNYLGKYLKKDIQSMGELSNILNAAGTKYLSISIRVYLNFLTEYNIANDEDIAHFRKILKSHKSNPDNFVPSDEKVRDAYNKASDGRHKTIFLLLAYSGIRITEAVKMLGEFDQDKLILNGDIAKYPLSYNRGKKKSFIRLYA